MKSNVILHVGCHKTGTTWLQLYFFNRLRGIDYYLKPVELPKPSNKTLLISNEEISQSLPYNYTGNQIDNLIKYKKIYPNAKIIIATRGFNSWLNSCYSESLRNGLYLTKKEFMSKYIACYDTYWFKKQVQKLWGEKNVYSYKFKDFCKNKNKILEEICEFIGVKMPEYEDKQIHVSLKNLEMCRLINIITPAKFIEKYFPSKVWFLHKILKKIMG